MSTNDRSYTAIVPWYDEDDFADLLAIGSDAIEPTQSYEVWYRSAMQSIDDLLRAGNAVAFVTIKPLAYIAWLDGAENTPEMRRRYAEHLATCAPPEINLHARNQRVDPANTMLGSSDGSDCLPPAIAESAVRGRSRG